MKFLILSENSNGAWPYLHYRSMAAFELQRRIKNYNYESTIIDWFTHWQENDLKIFIEKFFKDVDKPIIAISTPFNATDVLTIKSTLLWAKQKFPKIIIIHGGSRNFDNTFNDIIDIFFLGRSMEIFDAWLSKKDISKYIVQENPLVLVNHNFNEKIDTPVIPNLYDDSLTSKDILGFEVGVGCKFNCSFCNYELRNAKITTIADSYSLNKYFQEAYDKFGIVNFFASDDTINETDEKLETIAEAISNLTFHPKITAFARLDIVSARPNQIELFKKINFHSIFFGIESFNPKASKAVRKKSGLENTYETLKILRDECPDTYTVGGLILGLNKDNKESIYESVDKVINEKLLNSIQFYPLSITKPTGHLALDFYSDLDKDPEKFGYEILGHSQFHHGNKSIVSVNWKSDWSTLQESTQLEEELQKYCDGKIELLNHLEYAGMYALGVYKKNSCLKTLKHRSYIHSQALKKQYVAKKIGYNSSIN